MGGVEEGLLGIEEKVELDETGEGLERTERREGSGSGRQ